MTIENQNYVDCYKLAKSRDRLLGWNVNKKICGTVPLQKTVKIHDTSKQEENKRRYGDIDIKHLHISLL